MAAGSFAETMSHALIWINAQVPADWQKLLMTPEIDLVELASEIAEIARTAADSATAAKLLALADRLRSEAGLPSAGGGDPPPGPLHSAEVDLPALA